MKASEVPNSIGRSVVINPFRKLGIRSNLREIIGNNPCRLVMHCKNGLVQIEYEGKFYRIPMRNIELKYKF